MKFKVTYTEEFEREVVVDLNARTNDQAQSMLEEMSDSELVALLDNGVAKDARCTERYVTGVEEP